jgi:O-methyltransferase involved in polyketide biosynthesis
VDNGRGHFYDIDLPETIRFKKQLIAETDRYRMIGQSVLDFNWLDKLNTAGSPVLFLAEGLFMYLEENDVKALVLELLKRFPGSELVCELTNRKFVEGFWGRLTAAKLKSRLKMGRDARFRFGVADPRELENWAEGITFVEKWFYLESDHPKLGLLRSLRNSRMMRDAQYTAFYRLGKA